MIQHNKVTSSTQHCMACTKQLMTDNDRFTNIHD